jgi:hypothetical protein
MTGCSTQDPGAPACRLSPTAYAVARCMRVPLPPPLPSASCGPGSVRSRSVTLSTCSRRGIRRRDLRLSPSMTISDGPGWTFSAGIVEECSTLREPWSSRHTTGAPTGPDHNARTVDSSGNPAHGSTWTAWSTKRRMPRSSASIITTGSWQPPTRRVFPRLGPNRQRQPPSRAVRPVGPGLVSAAVPDSGPGRRPSILQRR